MDYVGQPASKAGLLAQFAAGGFRERLAGFVTAAGNSSPVGSVGVTNHHDAVVGVRHPDAGVVEPA
ncbi:hypothetical protein [Haladaptatus halobius]|uniref:hypothetical protein n=1 Tax=Haladaptatus halobius TaxID=2884875 RepID=UPI001D0A8A3F|nr:hypothetical protein [Haladaptatus halobius]